MGLWVASKKADTLVIVTGVGASLDFGPLKTSMARPTVIDLRNVYLPARHGFIYEKRRKANASSAAVRPISQGGPVTLR
jgi:hypothetical protein